jgi:hypothetical protein
VHSNQFYGPGPQCDQKIEIFFAQFLEKVAQNINIKAEFESLKPPQQTHVEALKYLQQAIR